MGRYKLTFSMFAIVAGYTITLRLLPYVMHGVGIDWQTGGASFVWNFSPIFAVSLFGGSQLSDSRQSLGVPLLLMLTSDLGIWALTGRADWAFYPSQFSVYLSLVACAAIGLLLRKRIGFWQLTSAALACCTLFFVVTNFAHWVFQDTYPKNGAGLLACYIAGLVTYRNSLLGTALFGAILFGPVLTYASDDKPVTVTNRDVEIT